MPAVSKAAPPISTHPLPMMGKAADPSRNIPAHAHRRSLADDTRVNDPVSYPTQSARAKKGDADLPARPESKHRASYSTQQSATSLGSTPTGASSTDSVHTILMPIQRPRVADSLSYHTVSQMSTSTRSSSRTRLLFGRIANKIGRSEEEPAPIIACGFLKRSTGLLSIAWWSDALPSNKKLPTRDPGLGWRPFKAVLYGSKIFFYKVPSVMVPEVRATFVVRSTVWPTPIESDDDGETPALERLAPAVVDDGVSAGESAASISSPPDQNQSENGRNLPEPHAGPWENATRHPDLVVVSSPNVPLSWTARIETGTPTALAHELVFATQSVADAASADETNFLHMLFYSLGIAGVPWDSFIYEVCEQLLLAEKLELHNTELGCLTRVARFVDVILWKRPLLAAAQENDFFVALETLTHKVRQSPEKYAQTLRQLRSWRDAVSTGSSIVAAPDWLHQSHSTANALRQANLAELHTCWTAHSFLARDAREIARQIQIFHAGRLRAFLTVPPTAYRLSSAMTEGILRSFRFDAVRPHWLSHVMLRHLLVDEAPERQLTPSHERSRGAILQHWIHVASQLLVIHDYSGWAAICGTLCSRPVAILEDAWRALPREERTMVAHEWSTRLMNLGWVDGIHNIVSPLLNEDASDVCAIPFFGNAGILPAARTGTTRSFISVRVAANEPEFLRARALGQQLAAFYPHTNVISARGEPIFEYQCLFQRLSQHEYPLHTAIVDYVGSAVAATALLDRRPLRVGGVRAPNAGAALAFPLVFPECTYLSPTAGITRFPSISAAAARASRCDNVQISPDLILRSASFARNVPIRDITRSVGSGASDSGIFIAEVSTATRERLLDVLVMGAQHLIVRTLASSGSDEYNVLKVGMDMDAFRDSFIFSYSGALAPSDFLSALRIRWAHAELASREMAFYSRMNMPNQFPSWAATASEPRFALEPPNREVLSTILLGIICALYRWLELRPTDWLPDQILAESLQGFMEEARRDLEMHAWATSDVRDALARLTCALERLPVQRIAAFGAGVLTESLPGEDISTNRTFDWKTYGAADLVDYLESVASPAYSQVSAADYVKAVALFDSQSLSDGGWLDLSGGSSAPKNMYEILARLPAERVCVRMFDMSVADVLASSLRELISIHGTFVAWIEAHITEPRIGLERRVQRLATLVDAVVIVRQRMRGGNCSHGELLAPMPPGFVETAILTALTSSASQTYYAAWDTLATRRNANVFAGLLGPVDAASFVPCTPDIGWVLGWIAGGSSHTTRDGNKLNCVSRLQIGGMISDALAAAVAPRTSLSTSRARLRWMREVGKPHGDTSVALEDAALEGAHIGRNAPHLFTGINDARSAHAALITKLLDEHIQSHAPVSDTTSSTLPVITDNKEPEPAASVPDILPSETKEHNEVSNVSLSDKHNDALLAAVPSQRVSSVFVCTGALLSVWPYQKHPFVFQLTSPSGSKCALKVPNYNEFCAWLAHLQALPNVRLESSFDAGMYAAKVAECANQGHGGHVFGVSLGELQQRDGKPVPLAIERLLCEVERRGLDEQGIYRVSGTKNAVDALRTTLDSTPAESLTVSRVDVHVIASVIKLWLRELPEPVVPYAFYRELLDTEYISDAEARILAMRELISRFPRHNSRVLRRFATHLALVTKNRKKNLMAPHNIGLVFSSTLLNPAPGSTSIAEGFSNLGRAAHVVKIMVVMHRQIFYEQGFSGVSGLL